MRKRSKIASITTALTLIAAVIWRDAVDSFLIDTAWRLGVSKESAATFFVRYPYVAIALLFTGGMLWIYWETRKPQAISQEHLSLRSTRVETKWDEDGHQRLENRLVMVFSVGALIEDPRMQIQFVVPETTIGLPVMLRPVEGSGRFIKGDHISFEVACSGDDPLRMSIGGREDQHVGDRYVITVSVSALNTDPVTAVCTVSLKDDEMIVNSAQQVSKIPV